MALNLNDGFLITNASCESGTAVKSFHDVVCWTEAILADCSCVFCVGRASVSLAWLLRCLQHMPYSSDWVYVYPIVCRGIFVCITWHCPL